MTDLGLGVVVSMKDAFSQNAGRIEGSMRSLDSTVAESSEKISRNLDRVQKGAMTMGAGIAMMSLPVALVASTAATQKALGELSSLGVADLNAIEDAAESFSNTWAGTSKAEFITATYDVKSAVSSLTDEAVGKFTGMAALTGKATKASTQEMVANFTTAYGIFKPIMQDMTDSEWAEAYSGGLAKAVSLFKTNGKQMADAIKNIGAVAASSKLPLEEQLAILGQLQTTMPGSEAGTQYKAFVTKAAEAGKKLGVDLVDTTTGRLKGIVPMLQAISARFPDLSQAAAQVKLKEAFGSDEAVKFLLQMSQNMGVVEGNIQSIETAMRDGTLVTEEMAQAMNMDIGSQFQLLRQQFSNLFEILGRTLLPVITPIIQGFQRMVLYFQNLANSSPGLTRVLLTVAMALGAVLVVFGGLLTAVGALGMMLPAIKVGLVAMGSAITGLGSSIAAAFLPVTATIGTVVLAVYLLRHIWESNFGGIRDAIISVWSRVRLAFQGIYALISSLKEGVGGMSADLARKLEAVGLMGFVTTVFQVYYRVRQFLVGIWTAFSDTFGKIRETLDPPVRALGKAFGSLFDAVFSIFEIFGLAATSADASTYYSLGDALGTILSILAQIGAFILRYIVDALSFVIRVIAVVIRSVVWLGKVIVGTFIDGAKWIAKFVLPVRLLVEGFKMVGKVIYSVWRVLSGDLSVLDGLKAIGVAVYDFLATPFRWARDAVLGVWSFIEGIFTKIGSFFEGTGSWLVSFFRNLPILGTIVDLFETIVSFFSGDTTFFDAGKNLLISLGKGIWSAVTYPFRLFKKALDWLWDLLPFSDSDEKSSEAGLEKSGSSILSSIGQGILSVIALPAQLVGEAMGAVTDAFSWAWDGLSSIAQGAWSVVSAPFGWIGISASNVWSGITDVASSVWEGMKSFGHNAWQAVTAPFHSIADVASNTWEGIKSAASSAWEWIRSPFEGIGDLASSAWDALFGSGPEGMTAPSVTGSAMALPAPEVATAIPGGVIQVGMPESPMVTGSVFQPLSYAEDGSPVPGFSHTVASPNIVPFENPQGNKSIFQEEVGIVPTRAAELQPHRAQLLSDIRSAFAGQAGFASGHSSRDKNAVVEAMVARFADVLSERPVEVRVTSVLDGRQVAQSVYKDMREQRVKNYETL